MLRPPSSSFFPYTSLFRSGRDVCRHRNIALGPHQHQFVGRIVIAGIDGDLDTAYELMLMGDRKSTRLNSSHVIIAYAGFGLKKKNLRRLYDKYAASCAP